MKWQFALQENFSHLNTATTLLTIADPKPKSEYKNKTTNDKILAKTPYPSVPRDLKANGKIIRVDPRFINLDKSTQVTFLTRMLLRLFFKTCTFKNLIKSNV